MVTVHVGDENSGELANFQIASDDLMLSTFSAVK
jgi:hypothetical protein